MRRLLTKMRVDRCACTSSSRRGWIAVQMDDRFAPAAGPLGISSASPIRAMSSTGTSILSSSRFFWDVSMIVTSRYAGAADSALNSSWMASSGSSTAIFAEPRPPLPAVDSRRPRDPWLRRLAAPPRNRATSSSGRCVAERPMRCGGVAVSACSRSSESARCAPRLTGTSAWISSMMMVSIDRSASRAFDVSSRYRDSGVVIRMSAGSR